LAGFLAEAGEGGGHTEEAVPLVTIFYLAGDDLKGFKHVDNVVDAAALHSEL
jgi:hypothetical protein